MKTVLPLFTFATLVTISHASFLLWAKKQKRARHAARMKLWRLHVHLNGTLWLIVAGWIISVQFYLPHYFYPVWAKLVGSLIILIGFILVVEARLLLGRSQAMGVRFFFPEKTKRIRTSLYRFLNNPMYDGFVLIFIGSGLAFGIREDFYLAIASFLLFNVFLSSIENFEFNVNPF